MPHPLMCVVGGCGWWAWQCLWGKSHYFINRAKHNHYLSISFNEFSHWHIFIIYHHTYEMCWSINLKFLAAQIQILRKTMRCPHPAPPPVGHGHCPQSQKNLLADLPQTLPSHCCQPHLWSNFHSSGTCILWMNSHLYLHRSISCMVASCRNSPWWCFSDMCIKCLS